MAIPWLALGAGALLGGLLGGSKGQSAKPKSISRLSPEQQLIAGQMQPRLSQRLGYPTGQSGQTGATTQPFGAELEDPAIAALRNILTGSAYGGLTTPDPRFAATYGMMGLRAVQAANQAILGREAQRLQGVPLAQQIWQEPYQMAQQYLQTPMTDTYLEQPAQNPLVSLLGAVAPIAGGYFTGGGTLAGLLGQTTTPRLSAQAHGYGSTQYPYY